MRPNEIRAAFCMADVKINAFAKKHGVSQAMIHQVITGVRPNAVIRAAIALEIVGKPVEEIWPDTKPEEQAA